MSDKKTENRKSLAILALPIGLGLGISIGSVIGSIAGNISMGICAGLMGGAGFGMIAFAAAYSVLNKKEK